MLGEPPPADERGPVHYQISVTGRQAGWFFALLLVVLGLSFFFGMKTGRAARRGPDAVGAIAMASDLPVPTIVPDAPTPTPVTEADKRLGFDDKIKSEPLPTATARPAPPTAAPTTAPKPTVKASGSRKEAPLWVQLLATKSAQAADELSKRLKKEGFPSDVSAVPGKSGWFRVRVGPYGDRAKAEAAAKKIRQVDKAIRNPPLVTP